MLSNGKLTGRSSVKGVKSAKGETGGEGLQSEKDGDADGAFRRNLNFINPNQGRRSRRGVGLGFGGRRAEDSDLMESAGGAGQ